VKGQVVNNRENYTDLVKRSAGCHEYFKGPSSKWPRGGNTLKEVQHNNRNGVMDVSPQTFEWSRYCLPEDVGLARGVRGSSFQIMGSRSKLTSKKDLATWNMMAGSRLHQVPDWARRPATAPSESEQTSSTLGIGMFSLTKGNTYDFLNCKPNTTPTPAFAQKIPPPLATQQAHKERRTERRDAKAAALSRWEGELYNIRELAGMSKPPGSLPNKR
jgi:hypothetical protein